MLQGRLLTDTSWCPTSTPHAAAELAGSTDATISPYPWRWSREPSGRSEAGCGVVSVSVCQSRQHVGDWGVCSTLLCCIRSGGESSESQSARDVGNWGGGGEAEAEAEAKDPPQPLCI